MTLADLRLAAIKHDRTLYFILFPHTHGAFLQYKNTRGVF